MKKRILITIPKFTQNGGVTSFYKAILPHMNWDDIQVQIMETGSDKNNRSQIHYFKDQVNLSAALRRRPNILHINPSLQIKSFLRDGLFALQAKCFGIPVLVFWHGWDKQFEKIIDRRYRWLFRALFGNVNRFIVLSSEFKNKLREWNIKVDIHIGTTAVDEKIINGFNLKEKQKNIWNSDDLKILFLARLEKSKGIYETIDAFKILIDKGRHATLTIAGDGRIRKNVESYSKKLMIDKRKIKFVGFVRDEKKKRVFTENIIYCLPTYYGEGLPTSILEAMAFGMPVITRNVGGISDIFIDGKMGIILKENTRNEIANAIEELGKDKKNLSKIASFNTEFSHDNFLSSRVAEEIYKIYKKMLFGNYVCGNVKQKSWS